MKSPLEGKSVTLHDMTLRDGMHPKRHQMTLGQMLEVNVVHTRRHLWQARQVRQQPGFPA